MLLKQKTQNQKLRLFSGIPLNTQGNFYQQGSCKRRARLSLQLIQEVFTSRQEKKTPRFLQSLTNTLPYKSAARKHQHLNCSENAQLHKLTELVLASETGRWVWQPRRKAQHLP